MNNRQRAEAAAKAEDLGNLLEHISWQEAVKPLLLKRREALSALLVQIVLGAVNPNSPQVYSKEQLAGAIYGIDTIIQTFEKILKDGQKALDELRMQGVAVSATSQGM